MKRLATSLFVLLLVPWSAPALAQEDSIPLRVEAIDAADHPDVSMVATMPPELIGKDLTVDDFTVLENGEAVALEVERLSSADLEVVLVLDTSGSMKGEPLREAKKAVAAFVQQMPDGVQVLVTNLVGLIGIWLYPQRLTEDGPTGRPGVALRSIGDRGVQFGAIARRENRHFLQAPSWIVACGNREPERVCQLIGGVRQPLPNVEGSFMMTDTKAKERHRHIRLA